MRIGFGFVLLIDIVIGHLPNVHDFWGPGSLAVVSERDAFAATFLWHAWFRGLANPLPLAAILAAFALLSGRLLFFLRRRSIEPISTTLVAWWGGAAAFALLAGWSWLDRWPRAHEHALRGKGSLLFAGLVWILATTVVILASRGPATRQWAPLVVWAGATAVLLGGGLRAYADRADGRSLPFDWLLIPWSESRHLIAVAMVALAVCAVLLILGAWTRAAAVTAWILVNAFDNLNPHMMNNGDVVRTTILFYLMLSPCGATWSLDRLWARQRGHREWPVWVHPWPLRLLMLQLILIYCFNGLYKALGSGWRVGNSLYYVMADLYLTRVAYAQFPVPAVILRAMNYVVLIWETFFPVLLFVAPLRTLVLLIGVLFHLGIGATLDLGSFQAYMLCLYLPLVPWERWVRGPEPSNPPLAEPQPV